MRVDELREREDLSGILASTLAAGWSAQYGHELRVTDAAAGDGSGQRWKIQPLLGAYYVDGVDSDARRFLRDSFRYTPVRRRAPAQWALGTILGSRLMLRFTGTDGFRASPPIADARSLLVVPGNQRVRIFDFRRGTTRVLAKAGFDRTGMRREIALRSPAAPAVPFPRIHLFAEDATWFEEPLIDGYTLPRCPPWIRRTGVVRRALGLLDAWLVRDVHVVTARDYCDSLRDRVLEAATEVSARFNSALPPLAKWSDQLVTRAASLGAVQTAITHGDFQPGNILVDRSNEHVTLIDWEHSGPRFVQYDRMVFGLSTRSASGLSSRVRAFLAGETTSLALSTLPSGPAFRDAAVAMLLLEDLRFYLGETLTGPYTRVPRGLCGFLDELARLC